MERGYSNLLSHLHRTSSPLALSALQSSIAYYLANPPIVNPSPTPLAASVIGSSLFRPFSNTKLDALFIAFQHAAHHKYKEMQDEGYSLFTRGVKTRLNLWVNAILKGLQGGQAMMRLVCAGGLLAGLDELERAAPGMAVPSRRKVEDEVVLAVAEAVDLYASLSEAGLADWEKEFRPNTEGEHDPLSLALLMAAQSLHYVPSRKLKALPLSIFTPLLSSAIIAIFDHDGSPFLGRLRTSATHEGDNVSLSISFGQALDFLTSSPAFIAIAPLSKLCARTIFLLSESQPQEAWRVMSHILESLHACATAVEADWTASPLAEIVDDSAIAPESRQTTTQIWLGLKTLLFATIMVSQSVLSSVLFLAPPAGTGRASSSTSPPSSPSTLALLTLHTLSRLSFVISKFGGITTSSQTGFTELKRAVYTALDVLSADTAESERFARELCAACSVGANDGVPTSTRVRQHKTAFALACIEQLVPVLPAICIQTEVFPLCLLYLEDPAHRETFESAHSVVLAIFAAHAQRAALDDRLPHTQDPDRDLRDAAGFATRLTPFYARCLIENSADGRLNATQLRLAYAALVRSASTGAPLLAGVRTRGTSKGRSDTDTDADADALAWFCIDALLAALRAAGSPGQHERAQRLRLALIACVSSVRLAVLPRVLDALRGIVEEADAESRQALVDALFGELVERVGDGEKELAMQWWYENRVRLGGGARREESGDGKEVGARL